MFPRRVPIPSGLTSVSSVSEYVPWVKVMERKPIAYELPSPFESLEKPCEHDMMKDPDGSDGIRFMCGQHYDYLQARN